MGLGTGSNLREERAGASNPSTGKVEAGGSEFDFAISLGYVSVSRPQRKCWKRYGRSGNLAIPPVPTLCGDLDCPRPKRL